MPISTCWFYPNPCHPQFFFDYSTLSRFPFLNRLPRLQEVEEREKVVRHMWDVYTHSQRIRLPSFWQDAFEAAYEDLASELGEVRDTAVTEIARMSIRMVDLEPQTRHDKVILPMLLIPLANDLGSGGLLVLYLPPLFFVSLLAVAKLFISFHRRSRL